MAVDNTKIEPVAKQVYEKLVTDRDSYTQRAEKCAEYTLARLFPKDSDDGTTTFKSSQCAVGARGVNNLASKLLLALLPPSQPFFRLGLTPDKDQKLEALGDSQVRDDIELGLSLMEQSMMRYIEAISFRPTLIEALKHLIVAGNALLFLPPKEGGVKCYSLRDYVVERDGVGNVLQLVAKDELSVGSLPPDVVSLLENPEADPNTKVEIYNHIRYSAEEDKYISYQEVDGKIIPETEQSYPKNKTPWIPIRFTKIDGESYGRSFVEDYLDDLKSLNDLTKALVDMSKISAKVTFLVSPSCQTNVDMSKISAKVTFLVSPSCQTNIKALAKAPNGAYVKGRPEDIVPVQLNKSGDMTVTQAMASTLETRLSYCFLLNSSVQAGASGRDRVTAEEIRYVASELEDTLGGVYALLSQELQLPLVRCIFNQMQSRGMLPQIANIEKDVASELEDTLGGVYALLSQELQLPLVRCIFNQMQSRGMLPQIANIEKDIDPTITTGLDALGRGADFRKLNEALSVLVQFPEFAQSLNQGNLATRVFTSAGTTGLDALGRGADFRKLNEALSVLVQFPEFAQSLNQGNLATRVFTSAGIDPTGLVKSPEEVAMEQQQAMAQQGELMGMEAGAQVAVEQAKQKG